MVKNFRCPGCGATIEYDPKDGKMHCPYCRSAYDPEKIGKKREKSTIRMNIAVCNSCGAELAVNAVEVSSFCPYCGNAAVVMDRVEDRLAPDYILPFEITKEKAESIIRERVRASFFAPKEVKEFEIERLNGVYIPFWLYDVYYGADQRWSYITPRTEQQVVNNARVLADCVCRWMSVDASQRFDDISSQRLEPFKVQDLKPFNASYLSGFYSDRFDVGREEADRIAYDRVEEMYDKSIRETLHAASAGILDSNPRKSILKASYALFPVWFLTFRYGDRPHTLLVNGQTGKMVGAVPVSKKKVWGVFAALAAVLCFALGFLGKFCQDTLTDREYGNSDGAATLILLVLGVTALITLGLAIGRWIGLRKSQKLSRSVDNHRLAKERQVKNG